MLTHRCCHISLRVANSHGSSRCTAALFLTLFNSPSSIKRGLRRTRKVQTASADAAALCIRRTHMTLNTISVSQPVAQCTLVSKCLTWSLKKPTCSPAPPLSTIVTSQTNGNRITATSCCFSACVSIRIRRRLSL